MTRLLDQYVVCKELTSERTADVSSDSVDKLTKQGDIRN